MPTADLAAVIAPRLLPHLSRSKGKRAGLLAELLGVSRRRAYDYLRALEAVGLVERSAGRKLWLAAG